MKKILTTLMCMMLVLAFTACGGNERAETEPQDISLSLSTDENDIEYMQSSDLSVFGLEKAENCELSLDFTDNEKTDEGFTVFQDEKITHSRYSARLQQPCRRF